jgi:tRNA pseudouridine55 synthase
VGAPDGLIVLDKPAGMTSHDVVSRVRRLARTRRVGHGGTLDPMATGVLIIGVGRATRLLTYVIGSDKRYDATIRLGQSTLTDDAEGEVVATASPPAVTALTGKAIEAALAAQTGSIMQTPSAVSAIKIDGKRAYKRVRSGEAVEIAARPVTISSLDILDVRRYGDVIDVDVSVACSSGTYIRAIARDLGVALGVGGHLTALRRTAVGAFDLATAVTLPDLQARVEAGESPLSLSLDEASARYFPRRIASAEEAKVLSHGGTLSTVGLPSPYAVFSGSGHVIAIVSERGGRARADVVLAPAP